MKRRIVGAPPGPPPIFSFPIDPSVEVPDSMEMREGGMAVESEVFQTSLFATVEGEVVRVQKLSSDWYKEPLYEVEEVLNKVSFSRLFELPPPDGAVAIHIRGSDGAIHKLAPVFPSSFVGVGTKTLPGEEIGTIAENVILWTIERPGGGGVINDTPQLWAAERGAEILPPADAMEAVRGRAADSLRPKPAPAAAKKEEGGGALALIIIVAVGGLVLARRR